MDLEIEKSLDLGYQTIKNITNEQFEQIRKSFDETYKIRFQSMGEIS